MVADPEKPELDLVKDSFAGLKKTVEDLSSELQKEREAKTKLEELKKRRAA